VLPDGTITTFAGAGQGFSGDGGAAADAQLNFPSGVALDPAGNIYVADQNNNRVRMVSSDGTITTVAGGSGASVPLVAPRGVAVDRAGNLYIADSGEGRILMVTSTGATNVAGNGGCCYTGDGGVATSAQLNLPWGLTVDATGNVYVSDAGNNAVRMLAARVVIPALTGVANVHRR